MKTYYKRIPFDLEKAKRIMNGEIKGKIVTENGCNVRIICYDYKTIDGSEIIGLVRVTPDEECILAYKQDGICVYNCNKEKYKLHIEIPTYRRDYSNFKPQKWQPCLVRDSYYQNWCVQVCSGQDAYGTTRFYGNNSQITWAQILPLSKVTERLFGTTKGYEELITELDNEQS